VIAGASWFQTHPPDREFDQANTQAIGRSLTATKPAHSMAGALKEQLNAVDPQGLSQLVAHLRTNHGTIRFKFYSKDAPKTSLRIAELIESQFYDGLIFFRVVPQFTVQTGDPDGLGTGGSGVSLAPEWNKRVHSEGAIGLARGADPHSGDSQFYITLAPQPQLDGQYTVFGQVIEGLDVLKKIQRGDRIIQLTLEK
jgi:cyclophilin family peptidyl-prolyl cis-trans isomerase